MTRVPDRQRQSDALAQQLAWQIAACGKHAEDCSLLVLRLLDHPAHAPAPAELPSLHAHLAERLRGLVRGGDSIEVAGTVGVGVVLHEAGYAGARAALERISGALTAATPTDDPSYLVALGLTTSTVEWRNEGAVADAVRRAWQAQNVVLTALPRAKPDELAAQPGTLAGTTGTAAQALRRPRRAAARVKPQLAAGEDVPSQSAAAANTPGSAVMRERALALGVPYVELPSRVSLACRRAVAPGLARELRVVPIGRTRGTLTVAMGDPADSAAVQRLSVETGLSIFPVLASPDALDRALSQLAGR
jgi:hypothetical protein